MREKKYDKTSAEIKKEEKEARLTEGRRLASELDALFANVRGRFHNAEKAGTVPDEGVMRGMRKNIQYLSAGLRRLRDSGADASFAPSQLNILSAKLNKWMAGEGPGGAAAAKPGAPQAAVDKKTPTTGPRIDELLQRVRRGSGAVSDPALQEIIMLLKAIAKKKLMKEETMLVASRARKLLSENKRTEIEVENFLKDKFVEPVLTAIFGAFLKKMQEAHVTLPQETLAYIESCVKGGKSRKEFVNLLLDRQTGMHLLD